MVQLNSIKTALYLLLEAGNGREVTKRPKTAFFALRPCSRLEITQIWGS